MFLCLSVPICEVGSAKPPPFPVITTLVALDITSEDQGLPSQFSILVCRVFDSTVFLALERPVI